MGEGDNLQGSASMNSVEQRPQTVPEKPEGFRPFEQPKSARSRNTLQELRSGSVIIL